MAKEMVHHPEHYQGKGGLEVWQVQEAFTADLKGVIAGDACALIKYACRWPKKNGVEDLKKIIEYANHLIEKLEEEPATEMQEDVIRHRLEAMIEDVRFPTEEAANKILDTIQGICKRDGYLMVSAFLAHCNIDIRSVEGKYTHGWRNLDHAKVYETWEMPSINYPNGLSTWYIKLPPIKNFITEKESN